MEFNKWDIRFIRLAKHISSWSTCLSRHVGAVLVKDKKILTMGYNGAPANIRNCEELGFCFRSKNGYGSGEGLEVCRATHAEQNAIIQASLHGVKIAGSTLYVTTSPCTHCAKMLINAGIERVVFIDKYKPNGVYLLESVGIKTLRVNDNEI